MKTSTKDSTTILLIVICFWLSLLTVISLTGRFGEVDFSLSFINNVEVNSDEFSEIGTGKDIHVGVLKDEPAVLKPSETERAFVQPNTFDSIPRSSQSIDEELVAYYKFNGNAIDASENKLHGKDSDAVFIRNNTSTGDKALSCQTPTSLIEIPSTAIDAANFSISGHFKISKDKYAQSIIGNYVACSYSGQGFQLIYYGSAANGDPRLSLYIGGKMAITKHGSLVDSKWHHFVLTFTDEKCALHLDQHVIESQSMTYHRTKEPLLIGNSKSASHDCGYGNSRNFSGLLDEFRIYSKELSQEDISTIARVGNL